MGFDESSGNYLTSSDHRTGDDLDIVRAFLCGHRFRRMLDVASAAGHFANSISADTKIITDLSPNMLKKAYEAFGLGLSAVAEAEHLPFLPSAFDFVGCRIAMHHFSSPSDFIKETFRILETGGLFVLIDSVVDADDTRMNRLEKIRDTSHVRSMAADEIIKMAEQAGFTTDMVRIFSKQHNFREWAMRLDPSERQYAEIERAFLDLPEDYKKKYKITVSGRRVTSYTDAKAVFIFKKNPA